MMEKKLDKSHLLVFSFFSLISMSLIHTHTHSHSHTHTHSHTHAHSLIHTHMHTHSFTHTHSLTHTHTHSHTYTYTISFTNALIHTHTHTHSHSHTHARENQIRDMMINGILDYDFKCFLCSFVLTDLVAWYFPSWTLAEKCFFYDCKVFKHFKDHFNHT